jgi:queuine tRNA-ribosyltransferase
MRQIHTQHGDLALPAFLPDATRGVVRGVDAQDLEAAGVPGVVVNAFHLGLNPGSKAVAALGGIHAMMGWKRPVISDSGGFQVFSLIRSGQVRGAITRKGVHYASPSGRQSEWLTPEKSIQTQLRLGADILVCLDDCTHPDDPPEEQAASVERTIGWARRCKEEFERGSERLADNLPKVSNLREVEEEDRLKAGLRTKDEDPLKGGLQTRDPLEAGRPLLFGVIQGGSDPKLRRECAAALVDIGFDGYGFGGWPFDSEKRLLAEILALTAELMPADKPKYALGIGSPANLIACARMGYNLFDCALPTRDARRGRLYVFRSDSPADLGYGRIYLQDERHRRASGPVSEFCDCLACRDHSLAYLHHLFTIRDGLAARLATIHNLRFYAQLLERLKDPQSGTRPGRQRG